MSLNIQSMPVVKVQTPETDLGKEKFYSVLKGGPLIPILYSSQESGMISIMV